MKTAEEWIELAAIEYSKHGQKNRLDFIRAIQQDAQQDALIKQLGEALGLVIEEKYCGVEPATTANGCYTDSDDEISARLAILAYNNYLRERGE